MVTEIQLEIPIDNQLSIFTGHIDDTRNERIIFSGIFGIGKSYFLEKYFEKQSDKYLPISLAPVNYSISSNEDIFRLIKYDILYELILTHKLEFEQEVISRQIAYGTIFSTKANSFLEGFLTTVPLLNKALGGSNELPDPTPLISFLKKISPQIEEIERQRKDPNLYERVLSYIKDLEESAVFESDFITGFITEALDKLATKYEQKKLKVLIIDDLDRIDPEHIFRLFNIFSTHLSHRKNCNKFGFDKIIFVCDVENIRNIFSARYGANVDFSGYIDKFYSTEIFYFENSDEIAAITSEVIESIDFGKHNSFMKESLFANKEYGLLNFLLKQLVNSGSLNMRRIKSVYRNRFNFTERKVFLRGTKHSVENWRLPAVIAIEILIWIYGDMDSLQKALEKAMLYEISRGRELPMLPGIQERIAGHFIPIIDGPKHNFEIIYGDSIANQKLDFDFEGQKIPYNLIRFGNRKDEYYANIIFQSDVDYSPLNNHPFKIIIDAFTKLKESGYFYK